MQLFADLREVGHVAVPSFSAKKEDGGVSVEMCVAPDGKEELKKTLQGKGADITGALGQAFSAWLGQEVIFIRKPGQNKQVCIAACLPFSGKEMWSGCIEQNAGDFTIAIACLNAFLRLRRS